MKRGRFYRKADGGATCPQGLQSLNTISMRSWAKYLLFPVMPAVQTARQYDLLKLRRDAIAGLTVASLDLPQAIAYAVMAGVPPLYWVYT